MNLVLLGGESVSNKPWIESVNQALSPLFSKTSVLYYDHWQTSEGTINLEREYAKLTALAKDLNDYVIFAKSIGSVLTAKGVFEKVLNPQKGIFVGAAWLVGEENMPEFKNWVEGFSIPSLFITKTSDPVAPAAKFRDLLDRYHVQNYQFVEIPGDNHKYENLEEIKSLVTDFLKS